MPTCAAYGDRMLVDVRCLGYWLSTYPQDSSIQCESSPLDVEHCPGFLTLHSGLEGCLVHIWIELLSKWRQLLKTVLLECIEENLLSEPESVVKVDEVLVFRACGVAACFGHGRKGEVHVINRFNKIFGELLDGKVLCLTDFPLGSVL